MHLTWTLGRFALGSNQPALGPVVTSCGLAVAPFRFGGAPCRGRVKAGETPLEEANAQAPRQQPGCGALDEREVLASPVGVVELSQDRDLVERQSHAHPKWHAEAELVSVRAGQDGGATSEKRDREPGKEVMHAESLPAWRVIQAPHPASNPRRSAPAFAYVVEHPTHAYRARKSQREPKAGP